MPETKKAALVTGAASGIGRATAVALAAAVLHKGNVCWELSGWAPKYFPPQLKIDIRSRLKDKVLFGSDYPSIPYRRLLSEWKELGYSDDIMERIFHANAERILGL